LVIILETEIWPNLFTSVKAYGAILLLANARISDVTWDRYYRFRAVFRPILRLPDLIFAQSETDRERYLQLGASGQTLTIAGNLKYDAATPPAEFLELSVPKAHPVWIAASTVGPNERGSLERHAIDEDNAVIDAFQKLGREFPNLLLILAPRQPARFDEVAEKLERTGISFVRKTRIEQNPDAELHLPGVLLLDTIGELSRLYTRADVAFVGGSLAPRGGHNILEPAAAGKPIVIGPHMQNFAEIAADFEAANAFVQIHAPSELAGAIAGLLREPAQARALGTRAQRLCQSKQGAAFRIAADVHRLYFPWAAQKLVSGPQRWILNSLAFLWSRGGAAKRARGEALLNSRPVLSVPVVSIGGITTGGSGKTPFCDYLAGEFRSRGYSPAILTRGYRRRYPARTVVLAPGTIISAAVTGDEAQIFLRSADAVIGIGADRLESANAALQFAPSTDLFLLDDGFQHARMARNFDVVLIDALDPFGGHAVVPKGRLREPLRELRRADAFVITRAETGEHFQAIREALRRYNSAAPTFQAQLLPIAWRSASSGAQIMITPGRRVAGFCGLGNPQNFWNTLRALQLDVAFRWAFGDHHQYKPTEIQRLADQARGQGADLLVTTEKDFINLPANSEKSLRGLEIAWLRVRLALTDPDGFFSYFQSALTRAR
jgi:tetraacyldisaccharide 4'-kinase